MSTITYYLLFKNFQHCNKYYFSNLKIIRSVYDIPYKSFHSGKPDFFKKTILLKLSRVQLSIANSQNWNASYNLNRWLRKFYRDGQRLEDFVGVVSKLQQSSRSPLLVKSILVEIQTAWQTLARNNEINRTLLLLRLKIDYSILTHHVQSGKISDKEAVFKINERWKKICEKYKDSLDLDSEFIYEYLQLRHQLGDMSGIFKEYQDLKLRGPSSSSELLYCQALIKLLIDKIENFYACWNTVKVSRVYHCDEMWKIVLELLQYYAKLNLIPDADLFNSCMKLAIHTSDPNAALRLFQEMRALKIIPLQSTFLILFENMKRLNEKLVNSVFQSLESEASKYLKDKKFLEMCMKVSARTHNYDFGEYIRGWCGSQQLQNSPLIWEYYMSLLLHKGKYDDCVNFFLQHFTREPPTRAVCEILSAVAKTTANPFLSARLLQLVHKHGYARTELFDVNTISAMRIDLSHCKDRNDLKKRVMSAIYLDNAIAYVNAGATEITGPVLLALAVSCRESGFLTRGLDILMKSSELEVTLDFALLKEYCLEGFNTHFRNMNENFLRILKFLHRSSYPLSSMNQLFDACKSKLQAAHAQEAKLFIESVKPDFLFSRSHNKTCL